MRPLTPDLRRRRLAAANPWWDGAGIPEGLRGLPPRAYLRRFAARARRGAAGRALVLAGPRGAGRTTLLHHLAAGLPGKGDGIVYAPLAQPLVAGIPIEDLADEAARAAGGEARTLLLDDVHRLPRWEERLVRLAAARPGLRVVAASAVAPAGRAARELDRFVLPPPTFHEHLAMRGEPDLVEADPEARTFRPRDVDELNRRFVDYVNDGGWARDGAAEPEDALGRALHDDLAPLCGLRDPRGLAALFALVARDTAGETSPGALSRLAGVTRPTLRRYLVFLERAFLVRIVHRVDLDARPHQRAARFRAHLVDPSLRRAVVGPTAADDPDMAPLAETAVVAQWLHSGLDLRYARWPGGAVDAVHLDRRGRPDWCASIGWAERPPGGMRALAAFAERHGGVAAFAAGRSTLQLAPELRRGGGLSVLPVSLYCYGAGYWTAPP